MHTHQPITHTTRPIVTGTSVVAIKTDSFVMMAADTLGSYGSLSRFHNINRVIKINNGTMLGAGGEISDFQQVTDALEALEFSNTMRLPILAQHITDQREQLLYG